ncbi:MAG: carboxypeptidase-like regulatory domain-containing protein [Acidobacteriota bacterium]|nr:carboxypeptidase-like regulatory domain-containing protein [Acidobacteriota bacterium]
MIPRAASTISRAFRIPAGAGALLGLFVFCGAPLFAVSSTKFTGTLEGIVTDAIGKPQMGATVLLFDRRERLCERVVTNEKGSFAFASLMPDVYALRVNLAAFLPAFKNNILVQAGMRSLLDVNLSSLFSSIQLMPMSPDQGALMTDDWKWVLRTASSTRPVLRILPGRRIDDSFPRRTQAAFSDTRGLVKVSAGDAGHISGFGSEADLGTAFAFATSLFGSNQLQFSGNLGYGSLSGVPSGGFRTTFSHPIGDTNPEISVTMRQLFVPGRGNPGQDNTLPPLRTLSVSFGDKTQIGDSLDLDYGFELDTVSFTDRLHYFSPYARLTYSLPNADSAQNAKNAKIDFTYTSGNARPELGLETAQSQGTELQRDIRSLEVLPRVSLRNRRAQVQRGENYELGISREFGSREVRFAAYREAVTNATLTMVSPDGQFFEGDTLPDLFSNSSVFNAGDYHTIGYTASIIQNVGDNYKLAVIYGSVGVLTPVSNELSSETPDGLRGLIRASRRDALTMRASGAAPLTGTRFSASYQISDSRSATPGHIYSTQSNRPEPGLNVYVRQPIPSLFGLPWRMEATADLSNLLAQGYLPIGLSNGRRLLLVQTPRSFRGGVSFTF